MKGWISRAVRLASFAAAFIVSVYAVSNLMPILLHTMRSGLNATNAISIVAYAVAIGLGIVILAREIYKLDRRAGRIRNKVGWFE
jgi:ABC-type nickel/cobalt efflux system permease component RcnA